jgi:hypothetical protein
MTNSQYYSNTVIANTNGIEIHISPIKNGKIDFWYNPPIGMWDFHSSKTIEQLETQLYNALKVFIGEGFNETIKYAIITTAESILRFWIENGWITINTFTFTKDNNNVSF